MIEQWVEQLRRDGDVSDTVLRALIESEAAGEPLAKAAYAVRQQWYGEDVYFRGLIEISSICKNDCYYCGIRRGNCKAQRYRLTMEEILDCCAQGWQLGYRTFVLQGGEDGWFTDERLCAIVRAIKERWNECAVTLSVGERSRESYAALREAGADRYLLRHETANEAHYALLHPSELSGAARKQCLFTLKELGFQVGAGFMVGAPGQTVDHLVEDLRFLQVLQPHMIGIGPFLSHRDTPFCDQPNGDLGRTLRLLSILRLMFPYALIPATTALGTLHPEGRQMGLRAGANVVMPNLSPRSVREKYRLYDNKIGADEEAAESLARLRAQVAQTGCHIVSSRGDVAANRRNGCT